jgi:hypothetical protein
MKKLLLLLTSIVLLTACNKQKKIYQEYVNDQLKTSQAFAKVFNMNVEGSYYCSDANFIKTITYNDSINFILKEISDNPISPDTTEKYLTSLKSKFDTLAKSFYLLKEGSDLDNYLTYSEQYNKYQTLSEQVSLYLTLFKKYNSDRNHVVGNLYDCKGTYKINGISKEKSDTVLFSPDKQSIISKNNLFK